jgi:hypothetical protein
MPRKIYEVLFANHEWILRPRGRKAISTFPTREEALERGREVCSANRPSTLKVGRKPPAELDG